MPARPALERACRERTRARRVAQPGAADSLPAPAGRCWRRNLNPAKRWFRNERLLAPLPKRGGLEVRSQVQPQMSAKPRGPDHPLNCFNARVRRPRTIILFKLQFLERRVIIPA